MHMQIRCSGIIQRLCRRTLWDRRGFIYYWLGLGSRFSYFQNKASDGVADYPDSGSELKNYVMGNMEREKKKGLKKTQPWENSFNWIGNVEREKAERKKKVHPCRDRLKLYLCPSLPPSFLLLSLFFSSLFFAPPTPSVWQKFERAGRGRLRAGELFRRPLWGWERNPPAYEAL